MSAATTTAIWDDRLDLVGELIEHPDWRDVPLSIRERLFDWSREPLHAMDAAADQLRARIRELEAVGQ